MCFYIRLLGRDGNIFPGSSPYPDVDWSDLDISNPTKANLIAFSSGLGDGGYPSFWGYGASNQPVCLVTDFGIFAHE
ncbi:MAG TPA: DUF4241 domain-containing protein [Oscillatoriaceae cyanobacterium M33_DOE_052]|nr:DUF4241 domain-containing protein [Oscillatoriaceae cyanobacterium M33_DOE_052]